MWFNRFLSDDINLTKKVVVKKVTLSLLYLKMMKVREIQVKYTSGSIDKPKVHCSSDAYDCIVSDWNLDTIELLEEVKLLLLNRANQVLGKYDLSKGGTTASIIDVKLVLSIALKTNAHAIILAHNQPSGNLQPSQADITMTNRIKKACKTVDLTLLDHLIISKEGYFSFADEGFL